MERSGSDLGNRHIFSPKSSLPGNEATLKYIARERSYRFSSQEYGPADQAIATDLKSFRNASDSFFKN